MGVLIGYMRVSKADGLQVLDLQKDALLAAGVDNKHIYEDSASGRKDDHPGLAVCLKALREGDTLVVWKLDRLGRDLRHLVNMVHDPHCGGDRFKSSNRPWGGDRHDHSFGKVDLWHLRRLGRV